MKWFEMRAAVTRAGDGRGQLTAVETIVVDFPRARVNHGIFRSVALTYRGRALTPTPESVTDTDGTAYEVDQDEKNVHVIWQIGDASTDVTGPETYVITYTVDNAAQDFGDHQELYSDVNGDEWVQPIGRTSLRLALDPSIDPAQLTGAVACYLPAGARCPISTAGAVTTARPTTWRAVGR